MFQAKSGLLYSQRFDPNILQSNPLVTGLMRAAFAKTFPTPAGRMLDLGCGTAFYYPLLSKHADSIVGVDVSGEMISEAQKGITQHQLTNCRVKECSAHDLPFDDASFDAVHIWDFLHHVADVPETLNQISRVLRCGGRLIAMEPNLLNPSITWYHARRRSEWRLFTQNQFSLVRQFRKEFDVRVSYDNTIISFLNDRTHWLWKSVNTLTSVKPFHLLSFRYVIDATKRK